MWSKEENELLKHNILEYCKVIFVLIVDLQSKATVELLLFSSPPTFL